MAVEIFILIPRFTNLRLSLPARSSDERYRKLKAINEQMQGGAGGK
jgi:hypothetical protein